jgi:hypothetical protein
VARRESQWVDGKAEYAVSPTEALQNTGPGDFRQGDYQRSILDFEHTPD